MTTMDETPQPPAQPGQAEAPPDPTDRVRIVSTPGTCGGKPRIAGSRIQVKHLAIMHERQGMSPEDIVSEFPHLTLVDVYAALAYYHDHREAMNAEIAADGAWYEEQKATQRFCPGSLPQKLAEMGLDYEELVSMGDTDRMLAKVREAGRTG